MHTEKVKKLLQLYTSFFKLGSISFGGGYSMLPLIEREVVEDKKWVDKERLVDIFAVAESLPGATALNTSAFVGYSIAGIPGAIAALLGNTTPSVIIVLAFSILFDRFGNNAYVKSAFRGIYPVIVALISYAAFKIGKSAIKDSMGILLVITAFAASLFFHIEPIPLIILGAVSGLVISYGKDFIRYKFVVKKGDHHV